MDSPLGPIQVQNVPDGGNATAAIRPNAFKIHTAKKGKSGTNKITGRILANHFMGVDVLLLVGVIGLETPLRIKVPANVLPQSQMAPGVDLELVPQSDGIFAFADHWYMENSNFAAFAIKGLIAKPPSFSLGCGSNVYGNTLNKLSQPNLEFLSWDKSEFGK